MDVLTVIWEAHGGATTDLTQVTNCCARCGGPAGDQQVRHVVSKVFTAFENWESSSADGHVCDRCAWAFQTTELRTKNWKIDLVARTATHITKQQVAAQLLTGPLEPTVALSVPLRPGRKHLLPTATWGHVTTDDSQLLWTKTNAAYLATIKNLRSHGFGSRMLLELAPPYQQLRKIPTSQWAEILEMWRSLRPWRSQTPWFNLALHITY